MDNLKNKIYNCEWYDSTDKKLFEERQNCKDLCYEYNSLKPSNTEKRNELLKSTLGKIGNNCLIEQPFMCDYGYNIELGENFYANHNMIILDCNKVKFGDNVFIGPNVSFYCPEHPLDAETRNKCLEKALPITVGNNVWIGGSVTILGGVTIGDGAVIGAGSVVKKDVEPNTIVVGNPAIVKYKLINGEKVSLS
ncbi:MAG: sugar O-acetyltransferase [Muribaculaceae bacterium]|nr:sugar O-acetyltransferase [Muribaculaceae bacterium]